MAQVIEKDIPGYKTGKRLAEYLHLKGAEKVFAIARFSKVNSLRKKFRVCSWDEKLG